MTIARHVSAESATDRDHARFPRHSANVCVGADVSSAQAERKLGSTLRPPKRTSRPRKGSIGRAHLQSRRYSPLPSCHSERLCRGPKGRAPSEAEGGNLLFPVPAIHESSGNSEIQIPPAPFRGGITIAPHVSAGSATDRDPARLAP